MYLFLVNVFFMWWFYRSLVNTDYTDKRIIWFLDGMMFSLNFACVLLHFWGQIMKTVLEFPYYLDAWLYCYKNNINHVQSIQKKDFRTWLVQF